jgi:lipoprotein-releasing system ATP-binding protein
MSSTNYTLRCENLHRYLGEGETRVHVLRGASLTLEPARVYAIVGPSGCGKSTLLYLLGLLDRQDDGDIWIRNELMSTASDEERTRARNQHIGFVFQFHFLLAEFSAMENLMWVWKINHIAWQISCLGGSSSVLLLRVHWRIVHLFYWRMSRQGIWM